MNLLPGTLYFGVDPTILVACADRLSRQETFTLDQFAQAIGAPTWEVPPVISEMVAAGFMTEAGHGKYEGTIKFLQLANARVSTGIPRPEAELLLEAVIAKATEINARPDTYPCSVGCIVVFGSYLGTAPVLGDLDIGVAIIEPPRTRERAIEITRRFMSGRALPSSKTYGALRLRQPRKISIHELTEVIGLGTPYRLVFGKLP